MTDREPTLHGGKFDGDQESGMGIAGSHLALIDMQLRFQFRGSRMVAHSATPRNWIS